MTAAIEGALRRLGRRVLLTIGRGRVTTSDDSGAVQTVQARLGDNEIIDAVPMLYGYGFTARPVEDTDLALIFIGGDRSNPIAIASNSQADRLKNLQPGESAAWHHDGKSIYLTNDGIIVEARGQPVTVNNASVVTVNASDSIDLNAPVINLNAPTEVNFNTPRITSSYTIGGGAEVDLSVKSFAVTAANQVQLTAPVIREN